MQTTTTQAAQATTTQAAQATPAQAAPATQAAAPMGYTQAAAPTVTTTQAAPAKKPRKQAAQTAQPAGTQTAVFRVVARGNLNGVRVRRVQNLPVVYTMQNLGAALAQAHAQGAIVAAQMCIGLGNPFYNVYPPVGEKCNGTPSKGFAIVAGCVVKVAAAA